jgi:hypothetical protein
LDSGLAGQPLRTTAAHLYDEARVRDLVDRPAINWPSVIAACPIGILVARRHLDPTRSRDQLIEELSGGWTEISPWTWLALTLRVDAHGSLPFLATVAGVVVLGADIVGTRAGSGGPRLDLATPGPWFDRFQGSRLLMGSGRPWALHLSRWVHAESVLGSP